MLAISLLLILMDFDRERRLDSLKSSKKYCRYCVDKGLRVDGLEGFVLNFGDETFMHVTFIEVDNIIYTLTPTPIGENCRTGGRFWGAQQHKTALNVDLA